MQETFSLRRNSENVKRVIALIDNQYLCTILEREMLSFIYQYF